MVTTLLTPRLLGRVAEVFVTALGASSLAASWSGSTASALLPYLAVPIVVPALSGGLRESLGLLALASACLAGAGAVDGHFDDERRGPRAYGLVVDQA